jgi:exosortase
MTDNAAFDETRIRTVVLVGGQDFGRCPLAARLPVALWPVAGKPALSRVLDHLADEGIRNVALCCSHAASNLIGGIEADRRLTPKLVIEELSSGTAGCLRDAVASDPGDLVLALSGSMVCPPSIRDLIEAYTASQADLTVVFNPDPSGESSHGTSAEIYLCRPDVLKLVPAGGYRDIKEGLIPAIVRAGGTIKPVVLSQEVGNFHDETGYLNAISLYLAKKMAGIDGYAFFERSDRWLVPTTVGAHVDPEARIYGPVAVAEGTQVARGAVVVGPAVLDCRTQIGENSVVVRSVLWDGCKIGAGCEIRGAVIERNAVVRDGSVVAEQTVLAGKRGLTCGPVGAGPARVRKRKVGLGELARQHFAGSDGTLPAWASLSRKQIAGVLGGGILLAAFLWSYWPVLEDLWTIWLRSDEYSAGLLVPFLAVYVLWSRRRELAYVSAKPAILCGTAIFVLAQAMRVFGLFWMYGFAERLSIVLSVMAIIILLLGWGGLRKTAGVLLFLCLMLPWPHRIQAQIGLPLQGWSTDSAVFCLELVGYDVARDGNVIGIGETNVAVAEACNGLRMIMAFLVISALVVLLVKRTWWEKMIILASSLPIALFCNTLRLAITAVFFTMLEGEKTRNLFHDFGGYAMMPLALALVIGEFWLLGRLVTPQAEVAPAVIARRRPQHAADS